MSATTRFPDLLLSNWLLVLLANFVAIKLFQVAGFLCFSFFFPSYVNILRCSAALTMVEIAGCYLVDVMAAVRNNILDEIVLVSVGKKCGIGCRGGICWRVKGGSCKQYNKIRSGSWCFSV